MTEKNILVVAVVGVVQMDIDLQLNGSFLRLHRTVLEPSNAMNRSRFGIATAIPSKYSE